MKLERRICPEKRRRRSRLSDAQDSLPQKLCPGCGVARVTNVKKDSIRGESRSAGITPNQIRVRWIAAPDGRASPASFRVRSETQADLLKVFAIQRFLSCTGNCAHLFC